MGTLFITKDEAIAALTAAAFTVTDEEDSSYGRALTHCMRSFIGADWDLSEAIETIQQASQVAWTDNPFNHDLTVLTDGSVYCFDVKRPAVEATP